MANFLLITCSFLLGLAACSSDPPQPAVKADPQQIDRLVQAAKKHIAQQRYDQASATLEDILQLDPKHYEALIGLGEIALRHKRFDQALPHLEKAYKEQPQRLEARFQLARTYRQLGRVDRALTLFEGIIAERPAYIPSRLMLADLLMTKAPPDPAGALVQYEAVLSQKPTHPLARQGAAATRLRLGQFRRAADELTAILATETSAPHLTYLLATAYYWLGEYAQAATFYRRAADALPAKTPQRQVRLWNLRLAMLAAGDDYPGDLPATYHLVPAQVAEQSPVRFVDIGATLGVAKMDRGRASAWGDYDNDGDLDLFSSGIQVPHSLYQNNGGTFADIAPQAGIADPRGGWSAICADYDGDGDLDLYVTRDAWEGAGPNSLYQNSGANTFSDIAPQAGVAGGGDSFTAAWGDADSDGDLDLYVAEGITGEGTANKLYQNRDDGTFADIAAKAGVAHPGKSLGVAWGDADNDGDLDLYVADIGGPNAFYQNRGDGTFVDIAPQAGLTHPLEGGYVAFFFDGDSDGDLDLFVSAMNYYEHFVESQLSGRSAHPSHPHFYRNDGADGFVENAAALGLARSFGSMGAGFGDVDFDGLIDIYLSNGGPIMHRFEPNILYHNRGDHFADITESAGVGNLGKGHGVAFADYDSDGDLDLYATVGGHYPGDQWANSLYQNQGHNNHWLAIELKGSDANPTAVGARLRLRSGNWVQSGEISSGGGFGCTNSLAVEFGLGASTLVDTLEIRWPSGQIEYHTNLAVDQFLHLAENP